METIWQDFRFSLRMLLRRPAFAVLALLTLALGIGANTAIFSVIYSVILRPLPYPGANSLVLIHGVNRDGRATTLSPLDFHDFVDQSGAFQSATAIEPETYNLTGKGEPERVAGASVSSTFFEVFEVPPALGRGFQPAEERLGPQA